MPLKPVFDKAPLTMLTSQPLRAGQVRVNLPALTRLYAQVENRREPLLLEGAFRLACLVKADAMQSPAVTAIREAAAAQREDGSFALTIEDSVYVLRAVWALYEAEAKKEDLTVLLRWFQWAAKQWDDIAADEYVARSRRICSNCWKRSTASRAFRPCSNLPAPCPPAR